MRVVQDRVKLKLRRYPSHPLRERWEQKLEEMQMAEEAYDLELRKGALKARIKKSGDIDIAVPPGGN